MTSIATPATVTIDIPGLTQIAISVTAESTVREIERKVGSLYWLGLEVDGSFTPLVQWKHLVSNKAMRAALDQAKSQVQAAIDALKPQHTPPAAFVKSIDYCRETHDYEMRLDGMLVGWAKTHYLAEVRLDELVAEILSGTYANSEQYAGEAA